MCERKRRGTCTLFTASLTYRPNLTTTKHFTLVPQCVPTELLPPRRHVQVAPRLCFFVVVAGFAAGFIRWSAGLFALAKAYT
eukprot:scaffold119014_cov75-Phaeocystis_antarctica.AAC.2